VLSLFAAVTVTMGAAHTPARAGNGCEHDFGTKTPVLLVHGFHEQPTGPKGVWTSGTPSMEAAVAKIPGVKVVTPFDYYSTANSATDWVTDPAIGAALAADITCLAHASAVNGGPGKVIIVAHSMGGLAVRCAVDPGCAGQGKATNPHQIALVVTLDTPNLGSLIANLGHSLAGGSAKREKVHVKSPGLFLCAYIPNCPQLADLLTAAGSQAAEAMQIGSQELKPKTLMPLPSLIPLDAIAGKITLTTTLFGIGGLFSITGAIGDVGDVVVSVKSAQDPQGTPHPGPGSWKPTLDCGAIPIDQLPEWGIKKVFNESLVQCWHMTETTDPIWQADVVTAIQPVAAALSLTTCTPTALTKGLLAANPQLNSSSWTLKSSACENGWAVAQVYAPAVGYGTAFLRRTSSGWNSAPLGEVNCSVIPGPLGSPLPPRTLAASLLRKAGICGKAPSPVPSPHTPSPSPSPPSPASVTVRVTVPANAGWIDTGIEVSPSDAVDVHANGSWTADGVNYTGPDGYGYSTLSADNFINLTDLGVCATCATTKYPEWGALMSYTGSAPPPPGSYTSTAVASQAMLIDFVGSHLSSTSWPYSGELWLGFNDDAYSDNTSDNYGQVTAVVTVRRA